MLEASRHLELAGMKDEAGKLREECVGQVSALMRRLKAAEAELAQLRKSTPAANTVHRDVPVETPCSYAPAATCCKPDCDQSKAVVVELQMLEIDCNKLRNLGFEFSSSSGEHSCSTVEALVKVAGKSNNEICGDSGFFGVLDNANGLMGCLKALEEEGIVKVLSNPTVMAVSGRPASFQMGGEIPIPGGDGRVLEYRKLGTELNLVPIITEGNQLRLEVRARHSELDKSRDAKVAGYTIPGLRVSEVDTGVEMKSGQTWIVGGMASNRTDGDKQTPVELLMIVKPEIVEKPQCRTACKATPCGNCECAPCGNCKPASHEETPSVPMPSF
jgi:Flp pilus assembly secretin CpaC